MRHETTEYAEARRTLADRWVPACGGLEVPTRTRSGHVLLYCYNFAEGRHAYLDVESDMIVPDETAFVLLNPEEYR